MKPIYIVSRWYERLICKNHHWLNMIYKINLFVHRYWNMSSPDFTVWSVILPAKDISGVKGTATIHIITSEIAKFKMKKFVTECMLVFRTTTVMTGNWIRKLKLLHLFFCALEENQNLKRFLLFMYADNDIQ